jgi:hypothetical protein
MQSPNLDQQATLLLKMVDSTSRMRGEMVVRGSEVKATLGLSSQELVKLLMDLSSKNLISVSGPLTEDRIDFAVISVHPANRGFVRAL